MEKLERRKIAFALEEENRRSLHYAPPDFLSR
jgi:hypothetical protein